MAVFDPAHRVVAILILDSEGSRVFAKYYDPAAATATANPTAAANSTFPFNTLAKQLAFEKQIHAKRPRTDSSDSAGERLPGHPDVLIVDRHLVLWCAQADVAFYVVGGILDNEVVLGSVLSCFQECLNSLLKETVGKKELLESFEIIAIVVDEMVDDGLILDVSGFDLVPFIQTNFVSQRSALSSAF